MINQNSIDIENNNRFFKLVFQSIEEGLIITNSVGEIVFLNFRTQELFGYTEHELIGQKVELLIPKKHHKSHVGQRETYTSNPTRKTMGSGRELEALRKNGTQFYAEISLNHIVVDDSKYIVALITDITKRVQAEHQIKQLNSELEEKVYERTRELEESQVLYTAVARNFPNGTINVFDKNLNYIFAEGKELYKHGITSQKLIGTNYIDRLSKEVRTTIEVALKAVFKGEVRDFELEHEDQYYNINVVPLFNDKQEIDKILLVEKNITAQKVINQKLQDSLEKEKEINEMKSRFVSMASHEFRTPLSTILSSNTLIEKYIEKGEHDKAFKHTKRVKSSVKGLTDILNDFLSTDKLENNKFVIKNELFDYHLFVNEVQEELQTICKDNQQILTEINGESGLISSDRNVIKNILYNLISNSIKYSKEGQNIHYKSSIHDDYLEFQIIDQGIGIPEADQPSLFNRFYRAENALNIKGTGLGLSIVKRYLDLLNGSIIFESKENVKTVFTCKIPIDYE